MPELPEVETVKNGLTPTLLDQSIKSMDIYRYDLRITAPKNTKKLLEGATVIALDRRSKYLYIHLSNKYTLIVHLGMSGTLTIQEIGTQARKHDHFILKTAHKQIHFNDPRRFGFFDAQKTEEIPNLKYISHLGIEPLSHKFTPELLHTIMRNKNAPIKNLIMDNKYIVGVGNIYACESLFYAGIYPFMPAKCVNYSAIFALHQAIINTLKNAIKSGGSSLKDHKQADGKLGYFQHNFQVYGRKGELCLKCNNKIVSEKRSGRTTFYCPNCQKM